MLKKISLSFVLLSSLTACHQEVERTTVRRAEIWQPQIEFPSSVVVCRSKQCAPAKLSMSKEYIYNSLMHLLDNNTQNKALVCTADSASHVCTQPYLTLPITVGITPANMYIDAVKISDISASLGSKSLDLLLNYDVTYNGQTPTCKPAQTLVYVKNASNIIMEDGGYQCKMTTIGNTTIKTLFAIDYIDLDYGYIGGYYSIGLSGPAYGGGSGYMLLRLPNDAYPLSPTLMMPAESEQPAIEADLSLIQASADAAPEPEVNVPNPVPCLTPKNCSPALDKKMMVKEAPQSQAMTEVKKSVETTSAKLKEPSEYNGVQVFPLPPKKKAQPAPAAVRPSKADEKLQEVIESLNDDSTSAPETKAEE